MKETAVSVIKVEKEWSTPSRKKTSSSFKKSLWTPPPAPRRTRKRKYNNMEKQEQRENESMLRAHYNLQEELEKIHKEDNKKDEEIHLANIYAHLNNLRDDRERLYQQHQNLNFEKNTIQCPQELVNTLDTKRYIVNTNSIMQDEYMQDMENQNVEEEEECIFYTTKKQQKENNHAQEPQRASCSQMDMRMNVWVALERLHFKESCKTPTRSAMFKQGLKRQELESTATPTNPVVHMTTRP